jgi:hypothetical protein
VSHKFHALEQVILQERDVERDSVNKQESLQGRIKEAYRVDG